MKMILKEDETLPTSEDIETYNIIKKDILNNINNLGDYILYMEHRYKISPYTYRMLMQYLKNNDIYYDDGNLY